MRAFRSSQPWLKRLAFLRIVGVLTAATFVISMFSCADQSSQPEESATEPATSDTPESQPEESVDLKANTLDWSTASEVDNFGYDIFRSESEDGPFDKVNKDPIMGAGTTDDVTRYQFVDDTIDPTKDYYYYIESISMNDVRERFTPVTKAPAKIKKADPEGGPANAEDG